MYKYLLLLATAALALPAQTQAQTERGARLLGVSVGDLRYTSYQGTNRHDLSVGVYPSVGWFVADRLAVGTRALLIYERYRSVGQGSNTPVKYTGSALSIGAAPFVRYYFYDGSKHKLFGQAGGEAAFVLNWSQREEGAYTTNDSDHGQSFGFHADLGYNYFITPNVALEATVVYRRSAYFDYIPDRNHTDSRFGNNSLDVRLGFSVFLPSGQASTAP